MKMAAAKLTTLPEICDNQMYEKILNKGPKFLNGYSRLRWRTLDSTVEDGTVDLLKKGVWYSRITRDTHGTADGTAEQDTVPVIYDGK